jgi:hypothetical protein
MKGSCDKEDSSRDFVLDLSSWRKVFSRKASYDL